MAKHERFWRSARSAQTIVVLPYQDELKRIAAANRDEQKRPQRPQRRLIGRWWTCPCGRLHQIKVDDKRLRAPVACGACGAIYPEGPCP